MAVLAVVFLRDLWITAQRVEEITYSQFEQALREGRVATVAFERARRLLERHRGVLESGAEQLLKQETLERSDLEALRARLNAAADVAPLQASLG